MNRIDTTLISLRYSMANITAKYDGFVNVFLHPFSAVLHLVIMYGSCENKSPFIFSERGQER